MSEPQYLPWDWHSAPLPENIVVGERTWIYSSFAFRHHRSRHPDGVSVGDDSGIYVDTDFLTGAVGRVRIGRMCSIGGAVFATNGTISIGDYAFVAHEVTFSDTAFAVPFDADDTTPGPETTVGENVWVGARATILGGSCIGDNAVIGAGAVVKGEVPAFSIAAGNPAAAVGRVPNAPS
jgi:acetyltransferase-like isoleucine patch superfamily enzyme